MIFFAFYFKTDWIPRVRKPTKAYCVQVSNMCSKNVHQCIQAVGGGHLGFFNFDIHMLGIQQIWIQHLSIPLKACVP